MLSAVNLLYHKTQSFSVLQERYAQGFAFALPWLFVYLIHPQQKGGWRLDSELDSDVYTTSLNIILKEITD
jgi:hypothetical protein